MSAGSRPWAIARRRFSVALLLWLPSCSFLFDVEAVLHDAVGGDLSPTAGHHRVAAIRASGRCWCTWDLWGVGLYYIVRKGILNWSQDKADL